MQGACDPEYLQSVYSEAAGPTYSRDVAAHLATQVRRDTALADELLERRVEHWPLLRLVYWPLGFLSRLVGSPLTGRGRRTETVVGEPFRIDGRPLADRIGLMRSRLLADHTAIASDLKLENEMPKDSYLAGRVEAAASRLIPEFEDRLLGDIRTRDRRPSIMGKMMLWFIALWFPILQPVLEGGLEMYLQDGRFAIVHGLYRIVSVFSAVHLLTGLAVVVIVFVVLLAAMYARALRAVRVALDPNQGLDSSTQLAAFVEHIAGEIEDVAEDLFAVTAAIDLIVRYRANGQKRRRTFADVLFVGAATVAFPNRNTGVSELIGVPFRVQIPEGSALADHITDEEDV